MLYFYLHNIAKLQQCNCNITKGLGLHLTLHLFTNIKKAVYLNWIWVCPEVLKANMIKAVQWHPYDNVGPSVSDQLSMVHVTLYSLFELDLGVPRGAKSQHD